MVELNGKGKWGSDCSIHGFWMNLLISCLAPCLLKYLQPPTPGSLGVWFLKQIFEIALHSHHSSPVVDMILLCTVS